MTDGAYRRIGSVDQVANEADWGWLARFDGLDDVDRQVLVLGLRPAGVRNEDVRAVSTDDVLGASIRLGRLRDRGLLRRRGDSKQRAWYVVPPEQQPAGAKPVDLGAKPVDLRSIQLQVQFQRDAPSPISWNIQNYLRIGENT